MFHRRSRSKIGQIPFTKLHGLGNDFVLIDARKKRIPLSNAAIRAIADRKRGVGFDQLLLLKKSSKAAQDAVLEIFNADGSKAEMCGNGLRAAALYIWNRGRAKELSVLTDAGLRIARSLKGEAIECEMGRPRILALPKALKPSSKIAGKAREMLVVNVGNPHLVVFVQKPLTQKELMTWGAFLETHRAFPKRTNVEFAVVKSSKKIEVQVWERGVGITEACGTGAVASACAAIALKKTASPVEVRFPGGHVHVTWKNTKASAFLQGTAAEVYSGVFSYQK